MSKTFDTSSTTVRPRIQKLVNALLDSTPRIEAERCRLITEFYKNNEALPLVLKRAKALEYILTNMTVVIRDDELIVGNFTAAPRSTQIFPEYSVNWLEKEFETVEQRTGDKFLIDEVEKAQILNDLVYWKGRSINDLATEYQSPDAKAAMMNAVFYVGNYYVNGVGHVSVDYEKALKVGFNGIIQEAKDEMEGLERTCPEDVKRCQFLQAVIITSQAIIDFARRFADLADQMVSQANGDRKQELRRIAEICRAVPANPAKSFYEALQSFWFVNAVIQIETNGHSISPMRFDQYMYPYYKADLDSGVLSKEDAQELIDCLWAKFNDHNKLRDTGGTKTFGGYPMFQNLCIGGQNKDGIDVTNDLSFACLEATVHVNMPSPSLSVRVWNQTPDELLLKCAEVNRRGMGMPAYFNDEVIIPSLISRGLTLEDARSYGIVGCVEPHTPGKMDGRQGAAFFNIAKVLEFTINNGKCPYGNQVGPQTGEFTSFTTFEQLLDAYRKQMEFFVAALINAENATDQAHYEWGASPYISSLMNDCIKRGKTIEQGGAVYNFIGVQAVGVANVTDSLYVLKHLVFDEKKYTLAQFKQAMDSNWGNVAETAAANNVITTEVVGDVIKRLLTEGGNITSEQLTKLSGMVGKTIGGSSNGSYGSMIQDIERVPKYGNDIEEVDLLAREVAMIYCREVVKYKNVRGGQFIPGCYPVSANVAMGSETGATPDGRKSGTPLADGISPVNGRAVNGPTAAANSVSTVDHAITTNGTLYNLKFHPSALSGQSGLEKLVALVRGFCDRKGMHIQFNVISKETLLDAQKNPDAYKNLVIRVAGYSAHFVSLDKGVQDDIISRTEEML